MVGFSDVVFTLIGAMVGSAIYSLSGITVMASGASAILSWVIGGALMFFYAMMVSELSLVYPKSGGIYVFPKMALGGAGRDGVLWGYVSAWGSINTNIIAVAFSAIYIPRFLSMVVGLSPAASAAASCLSVIGCFFLNLGDLKFKSRMNALLVTMLVAALAYYSVSCLMSPLFSLSNIVSGWAPEGKPLAFVPSVTVAQIGYGAVLSVAFMVGNVRDKERNLPLGTIAAISFTILLYVVCIFASCGIVTRDYLIRSHMEYAIFNAVIGLAFPGDGLMAHVVSVSAVIALITTMNVMMEMTARTIEAVAGDGLFPKALSRENGKGIPVAPLAVVCLSASLFAVAPLGTEDIVNLGAFFSVANIIINVLSYIAAVRKNGGAKFFNAGKILPWLILAAFFVSSCGNIVGGGLRQVLFTVAWYAVGFAIYFAGKGRKGFVDKGCKGFADKARRSSTPETSPASSILTVRGIVRHGNAIGRIIGFPTANLECGAAQGVETGVYVSLFGVGGKVFRGITNYGARPTVEDSGKVLLETHLLNFTGDLYGKEVEVSLLRFIRPIRKMDGLAELKAQIASDLRAAEDYFGKNDTGGHL